MPTPASSDLSHVAISIWYEELRLFLTKFNSLISSRRQELSEEIDFRVQFISSSIWFVFFIQVVTFLVETYFDASIERRKS